MSILLGSQTATSHPRCDRSAEDGSSRVPLPCGRTPRPFAVRVSRGLHSTLPTVRAGPTPTVAGCSRAAPERPLPKGSHLAVRNPSAPPSVTGEVVHSTRLLYPLAR